MMHYRRPLNRRPRQSRPLVLPAQRSASSADSSRMRALTLIYHEDFEAEITGVIRTHMLVARYTRIRDVIGARTDIIQDTDFTPSGSNNMLIVVGTSDEVHTLAEAFRSLRQYKGHGMRGYITSVEGLI